MNPNGYEPSVNDSIQRLWAEQGWPVQVLEIMPQESPDREAVINVIGYNSAAAPPPPPLSVAVSVNFSYGTVKSPSKL